MHVDGLAAVEGRGRIGGRADRDLLTWSERGARGREVDRPAFRQGGVAPPLAGGNGRHRSGGQPRAGIRLRRGPLLAAGRRRWYRVAIRFETEFTTLAGVVSELKDDLRRRVGRHHVGVGLPEVVVRI